MNKQGLDPAKLDGLKQRLADADAAKTESTDALAKLSKANDELQTVKADQEKQAQETQKLLKQVAQLTDEVQRGAGTSVSAKAAEQRALPLKRRCKRQKASSPSCVPARQEDR